MQPSSSVSETRSTKTRRHAAGRCGRFINPLEHDLVEMSEAVRNLHQYGCRPYATRGNIMRHNWDREANCVYTIDISGRRLRGPAEMLKCLVSRWMAVGELPGNTGRLDLESTPLTSSPTSRLMESSPTSKSSYGTTSQSSDDLHFGESVELLEPRDAVKYRRRYCYENGMHHLLC
jgi:hypothetical protein